MFRILVADDDAFIRKLMATVLKSHGFDVILAQDGAEALELMDSQHVDLVVLDVMMPHMDGYTFADTLRQNDCNLPILMISARQEVEARRRGFLVGIDDYMTKPVDEAEMILRIKALLRRANIVSQRKIVLGDVVLNYDSLTVTRGSQSETLPPKEFYLLYKLLAHPGQIFTRYQLLDELWGMETDAMDNTVVVHINRLRKRFADYPEFEIATVRGLGYKGVRHGS